MDNSNSSCNNSSSVVFPERDRLDDVRERRNVTERAMIVTTGPALPLDVPKIAESNTDQFRTLEEVEIRTSAWR